MYLSQPRDLMTSMSTGCSRSTTFLHNTDNLAHLPPFRGDYSFDSRRSVDRDPYPLQPPAERDYDQKQNLSPTRFVHSTGLVSPDPYSGAMSTSEGRSMSRLFRSQHFHEVWEKLDPGNVETRPPHPYTELIKLCILKRREGKLTLNQLYHDLEAKFPHFAASPKGAGWKNTLRHNLSTQPYFIKLEREHGQLGKGHYWAYCPDLEKPTSLAQSSIVQLSSLWPPSVSAASISPRDESKRSFSSATEFQRVRESSSLPRYRKHEETRKPYEMPCFYRRPMHECHRDEVPRMGSSSIHARRLSSPVRHLRPLEDRDVLPSSSSGMTRLRSATITTLSRPSAAAIAPLSSSSPAYDKKRSLSLWPSSSSPMSPYTDDINRDVGELPAAPSRSLSDWYLNNPISRRTSSVSSASSGVRSRYEPYSS